MDKLQSSFPLKILQTFTGFNLKEENNISKTRQYIFMFFFASNVFSGILELLTNLHNKNTIIRAFQIIFGEYYGIIKIAALAYHRKKIVKLLKRVQKFWPLDYFGTYQGRTLEKQHKLVKYCYQGYCSTALLTCMLFGIFSFLNNIPVILCYGETKGLSTPAFYTTVVVQAVFIICFSGMSFAFDGLFLYFVTHVVSEFQLIQIGFTTNLYKDEKRLEETVNHHIFILECAQEVNNIYSTFVLHQHVCCVIGLCISLIMMTIDGVPPDYQHVSQFGLCVILYAVIMFCYCFAGNIVIEASVNACNNLFYEDWIKTTAYKNKLNKLIILQRAQRPAAISLGGFRNLDLESFLLAMKNSFSLYTFVNALGR